MSTKRTKPTELPKPKGWKQIKPIAISDPRVDPKELPPGQQAKLVPFTELLDEDNVRWVDYHDGLGPIRRGGVPAVTGEKRTPGKKHDF